jgi:adenylate cyclase
LRLPRRGWLDEARALTLRRWLGFLVALLLGGGLGAVQLGAWGGDLLQELENRTLDWRFRLRGPQDPPPELAILAIDDGSLARLGQRWPPRRSVLAEALGKLNDAGAATIAIDLLLLEGELGSPTLSPGDQSVLGELRRHGNAVLALQLLFQEPGPLGAEQRAALATSAYRVVEKPARGGSQVPQAAGALVPLLPLAQAAGLGHVNLLLDEDGSPRRIHQAIAFEDLLLPSFPVVAARRFLGVPPDRALLSLGGSLMLGERRYRLDDGLGLPLDYYGPSGTIPTYALATLLEGKIAPERFAGKLVVIGGTASGLGDSFPSPFAQALPGVEVLATAIGNLLAEERLERPFGIERWEAVATVALALLAWLIVNLPRPRIATLLGLLAFALWPLVAYLAFVEAGLWLNVAWPTLGFVATAVLLAGGRTAHERALRREAERQRRNLARYVSPVLADQLASEDTLSFDRRLQDAAILFFDLSGSTRLAEGQEPGETASFLRAMHGRIEEAVARHAGVVVQFLGDGALVLFGLPEPRRDDPVRALACARDLIDSLARWRPGARSRAGLHYGQVVIARLGGAAQAQLTAAGDTVNVASRLESLAKAEGWALAVSDALIVAVLAEGGAALLAGLAPGGDHAMRGREGRLAVWWAPHDALVSPDSGSAA